MNDIPQAGSRVRPKKKKRGAGVRDVFTVLAMFSGQDAVEKLVGIRPKVRTLREVMSTLRTRGADEQKADTVMRAGAALGYHLGRGKMLKISPKGTVTIHLPEHLSKPGRLMLLDEEAGPSQVSLTLI